jgi:hypothetical protein
MDQMPFLALVTLIALFVIAYVILWMNRPVAPERVQRFAERQRLVITPGNRNQVITYLAITRRSRVIGLVTGGLLAAAWALRDSRISFNLSAALAGWFVGALVAEFRITGLAPGVQPAPSAERRLLRHWLRPPARTLPLVLAAVAGSAGSLSLLAAAAGRDVNVVPVLGQLGIAGLTLGLAVVAGRHILARPQPLGERPDQQLADDAQRDRSLHVLAGCAVALIGAPTANLVLALGRTATDRSFDAPLAVLSLGIMVFALFAGWLVANGSRPPFPVTITSPDEPTAIAGPA